MGNIGDIFTQASGGITGIIPGFAAAVTGAGKSTYSANNFAESPQYDPNKWEYGGAPGVADETVNRYQGSEDAYNQRAGGLYDRGNMNLAEGGRALEQSEGDAALGLGARKLGMDSRNMNLESRGLGMDSRNLNLQSRGLGMQSRNLGLESRGLGMQSRNLGLETRNLGLEARGRQADAQNLMIDRARGNNLIADRMAGAARNDLGARMHSAAASARGPAGLANAQSDAMAAEAQGLGQINTNATIQGMQEQRENEGAAFGAASGMREGDIGQRQGDTSMVQNDLGIRQGDSQMLQNDLGIRQGDTALQGSDANMRAGDATMQANDAAMRQGDATAENLAIQKGQAYGQLGATALNSSANMGNIALGYAGRANDVRNEQGTLGIANQQTLSASHAAEQNINSGTRAANAGQDLENVYKTAGATAGGAQAALNAPSSSTQIPTAPTTTASSGGTPPLQTSRAGGGPVLAGQTVLVGEKGPEVIVPQQSGYVIPNHALGRDLRVDEDRRHRQAQSSMDLALSQKADEKRNMVKSFHRDTPQEQQATREAYLADIERQMEALKASYKSMLAQGPSARRLSGGTPENDYETELTSGAEQAYRRKFGAEQGENYDLRGAHAEGLTDRAPVQYEEEDGRLIPTFPGHLPDTYKKPNHDTFSVESQYAPFAPERAGRWEGDRYVSPPDPQPMRTRNPNEGPYQDPDGPDNGDGTEDWSVWDSDNVEASRRQPHRDLRIAKRARGGPVQAGRPVLVGERGPEAVVTPRQLAAFYASNGRG